jgi:hypothetical protein
MAIIIEKNSIEYITHFTPVRCDTHFKHNIKLAENFFSRNYIAWVSLGSILEKVQNGMNVKTEYYSMEETGILYLSVSQIKEYGLIKKNQNYLTDEVKELKNYCELEKNTILVTRSGTTGIALSTNHPSFSFNEKTYIPSGFVITAKVKKEYSADIISHYINLFDVQKFLTAMASGACQKNITQPAIKNLPVPEVLLSGNGQFRELFREYEDETSTILTHIGRLEKQLTDLKKDISHSIKKKILAYYK